MRRAATTIPAVFSILFCLTVVTLVRAALPGEVTGVVWCDAQCLRWDATAGATSYRVYRGETASERCLLTSALDSCRAGSSYSVPTTGAGAIPENPGSRRFYWYLVTAILESGEGTSGNARIAGGPAARIRNDSGGCPLSCSASGKACSTDGDCCSSLCSGTCAPTCDCLMGGAQCVVPADCCSGVCASGVCTAMPDVCGNGIIRVGEQCDDGNQAAGDGCSPSCTGETGYACSGEPSICTPCPAGFANCNGGSQDGCEVDTRTDIGNCGQCRNVCAAVHATPSCSGGACHLTCDPGFADCNQNAFDGCERHLEDDPQNCGLCGRVCSFSQATASCSNGACQLAACNVGWGDCNHAPADGCETDLRSSPSNCGACEVECPTGICIDSTCRDCTPSGHSCPTHNCCAGSVCLSNFCCVFPGSSCTASDVCCSGNSCNNGTCCAPSGTPCTTPGIQCCAGLVCGVGGSCTTCRPSGSPCTILTTCCTGTCPGSGFRCP